MADGNGWDEDHDELDKWLNDGDAGEQATQGEVVPTTAAVGETTKKVGLADLDALLSSLHTHSATEASIRLDDGDEEDKIPTLVQDPPAIVSMTPPPPTVVEAGTGSVPPMAVPTNSDNTDGGTSDDAEDRAFLQLIQSFENKTTL